MGRDMNAISNKKAELNNVRGTNHALKKSRQML